MWRKNQGFFHTVLGFLLMWAAFVALQTTKQYSISRHVLSVYQRVPLGIPYFPASEKSWPYALGLLLGLHKNVVYAENSSKFDAFVDQTLTAIQTVPPVMLQNTWCEIECCFDVHKATEIILKSITVWKKLSSFNFAT